MITLHSVSKVLGRGTFRRLVLDDITWAIPPHGRFIILGHKGSGKSTLLNIMRGAKVPTSGWVERGGSISPARHMMVRPFMSKTPRQAALHLGRLYRVAPEQILEFAVRFAKLDGATDIPISSLANPMVQRLGYAFVYAIPFDFYLFDDSIGPAQGEFAKACQEAYEARCHEAGAIVTTSHARIAERLEGTGGVLHNGKIKLFETVGEAVSAFKNLPEPESSSTAERPMRRSEEVDDEDWL